MKEEIISNPWFVYTGLKCMGQQAVTGYPVYVLNYFFFKSSYFYTMVGGTSIHKSSVMVTDCCGVFPSHPSGSFGEGCVPPTLQGLIYLL